MRASEVGEAVFAGDGEMAARCRAMDWAVTPLGPVDQWPDALRTIVRSALESPFPINLWCGPQLVLIYNDAYARVLGAKHPGALGRSGADVWAEIWSVIAPMFQSIRAGGPPVYAEDAPFVMQRTGEREEDGDEAWFTFSLSPVRDDSGAIVAFLNIVAETTRRVLAEQRLTAAREAAERAEARLREVFIQAPAFLAVLRGEDHVFEFVNEAYLQLVGYRDVVGKPVLDALPEVRAQGFVDLLDNVLRTGQPFIGREVPVMLARSPGGPLEQRYVNFAYQPLRESAGSPVGIVAHGSDVTEQVLARRDVEAAREVAEAARREAEEANRAKSQFLATMSHELRTPLNAIGGYADLLLMGVRGELTNAQHDDVDRIKRSGQHLLGLINDILNFAKLEAGQVEFNTESVPLCSLLEGLQDLIRPQAVSKELRYHQAPCDPTLRVCADPEKVRQVLLNLLANAVKFTDTGGEISVSADADDEWARIRVRDTGRGIAPDQLARVFDPFVQVDRHQTPASQQGVGLGLAISRDLAVGMGGGLSAESALGKGSTFTLSLPRVNKPAAQRGTGKHDGS